MTLPSSTHCVDISNLSDSIRKGRRPIPVKVCRWVNDLN